MAISYQITSLDQYNREYKRSVEDPEGFWGDIASQFLWKKKWDKVLDWNFKEPDIKWFAGGKLNITENCLDRHVAKLGDSPAIIWEPNNPNEPTRTLTYSDLLFKVKQFSHVLKNNGIKKGDRVCIYMGMVPELAIAVLACARIGAIHSVVFGGFSAQSIADSEVITQNASPSGPTEEKTGNSSLSIVEELLHEDSFQFNFQVNSFLFLHHITDAEKLQIVHPELILRPPRA